MRALVRAHAHITYMRSLVTPICDSHVRRSHQDSIEDGIFLGGSDGERIPRLPRHLDCRCWRKMSLQVTLFTASLASFIAAGLIDADSSPLGLGSFEAFAK